MVEVVNSIDDVDLHRISPRYCVLNDFSLELFVTLRSDDKLSLNGEYPELSPIFGEIGFFLLQAFPNTGEKFLVVGIPLEIEPWPPWRCFALARRSSSISSLALRGSE